MDIVLIASHATFFILAAASVARTMIKVQATNPSKFGEV
jgi:hypothetical protein